MTNSAEQALEMLGVDIIRTVELTAEQKLEAKSRFQDLILSVFERNAGHPNLVTKWVRNPSGEVDRYVTGIQLRVDYSDGSNLKTTVMVVTSSDDFPGGFHATLVARQPDNDDYVCWEYEVDDTLPTGLVAPGAVYRSIHYGSPSIDAQFVQDSLAAMEWDDPMTAEDYQRELAAVGKLELESLQRIFEQGVPTDPPAWLSAL